MLIAFIRFGFALLVTAAALAPWYVELMLAVQEPPISSQIAAQDGGVNLAEGEKSIGVVVVKVILLALAVLAVSLLVWDLEPEGPWAGKYLTVAVIVAAVWLLSVTVRFRIGMDVVGRLRTPAIFAISSIWLPVLAWMPFWPMKFSSRVTVLCVLLLGQGFYPLLYRVQGRTDENQFIVRRRGEPAAQSLARGPTNRPGARPTEKSRSPGANPSPSAQAPTQPQLTSANDLVLLTAPEKLDRWKLLLHGGAAAELQRGVGKSPLTIQITGDPGKDRSQIQLSYGKIAARGGNEGELQFRVRSTAPRTIAVHVSQDHDPWQGLGFYHEAELQPGMWNIFIWPVRTNTSDPNARLVFDLGGSKETLEFDYVRFGSASGPTSATPPAAAATQPRKDPTPTKPAAQPSVDFVGWSMISESGYPSTWSFVSPDGFLRADVPAAPKPWNIKLERRIESVESGRKYLVRLRARANVDRPIAIDLSLPVAPWSNMGLYQDVPLGKDWQEKDLHFTATATGEARLHVNLGGPPSRVEISRLEFKSEP